MIIILFPVKSHKTIPLIVKIFRRNDVSANKAWGYCDKKCYSQFVDAGKLQATPPVTL